MTIPNLEFPDFEVPDPNFEAKIILETIKLFFDSNVNSKVDLFNEICHPKLSRLGIGNSNELYWMTRPRLLQEP